MCGGIVARASRTRNSKLAFLLLLFSIAHLPLLRHADAKILRGDLVTREVTNINGLIYERNRASHRFFAILAKLQSIPLEAVFTRSILLRDACKQNRRL